MPHQIGYTDNSSILAHYAMLDTIRRFAAGYGTLGATSYSGTGNGTLSSLDTTAQTVTETWTLTCTAAESGGGTFSVVGSVSGNQGTASVGTAYSNSFLEFTCCVPDDQIVRRSYPLLACRGILRHVLQERINACQTA